MLNTEQTTSNKAITGKIRSIKKRGKTLDNDIQTVIRLCAVHAHKFGDHTCFGHLFAALPNSAKTATIVSYICAVTPLNFNSKDKRFVLTKNKDKRRPFDFETINNIPFWEYEKEPAVKKVNVNNLLILSDLIEKALKSVENADEIIGDLPQFQARVAKYRDLLKPVNEEQEETKSALDKTLLADALSVLGEVKVLENSKAA